MTKNEARILVHLWRHKGSYAIRISRSLKMPRSTVSYLLQRLRERGIIFETRSPVAGVRIYKLSDTGKTRAFLSAAFKLCVSESIGGGTIGKEIFD